MHVYNRPIPVVRRIGHVQDGRHAMQLIVVPVPIQLQEHKQEHAQIRTTVELHQASQVNHSLVP